MALPVTINSSAFVAQNYFSGPFKAPNGQYYVVILESTGSTPEVFMATDPTSSFTAQDTSNNPTTTPLSMWSYLSGSEIYIATARADGNNPEIQYHVFDTDSDAWTTTDEEIENTKNVDAGFESVSIAVRSDGDVIVLYNGSVDTDMGNPYERVDYARKEGGSWTAGIDVGGTSPAAEDRSGSVVIRGSVDNMHFFWGDLPNDDIFGRSLDSSNTLSSERTQTNKRLAWHTFRPGFSWDDSGTWRVVAVYGDKNASRAMCWRHTESSGALADNGGLTRIADFPGSTLQTINGTPIYSGAVDGDGEGYVMWSGNDSDLYRDNDPPPYTTADWSTDIEVHDAVTINRISCNIYQRGANIRLAYVYDDGGTIKYNEVDLGAAVAGGGTLALPHRKYERHNLLR